MQVYIFTPKNNIYDTCSSDILSENTCLRWLPEANILKILDWSKSSGELEVPVAWDWLMFRSQVCLEIYQESSSASAPWFGSLISSTRTVSLHSSLPDKSSALTRWKNLVQAQTLIKEDCHLAYKWCSLWSIFMQKIKLHFSRETWTMWCFSCNWFDCKGQENMFIAQNNSLEFKWLGLPWVLNGHY